MAERVERKPELKIIEGHKGISSVSELPVKKALADFETLAKHIMKLGGANTDEAVDDVAHMYDHRLAKYPEQAREAMLRFMYPEDADDDPDPSVA